MLRTGLSVDHSWFISHGSGIIYHNSVLGTAKDRLLPTWDASHRHTLTRAIWPLRSGAICLAIVISQRTPSSAAVYMGGSQNPQLHSLPPSAVMEHFLKAQIFPACSFSLSSSKSTFIRQVLANLIPVSQAPGRNSGALKQGSLIIVSLIPSYSLRQESLAASDQDGKTEKRQKCVLR